MKDQLLRLLFLSSLILMVCSCQENEDLGISQEGEDIPGSVENQSQFVIHAGEIQGLSGDRYIMATAPLTGEVLFWDVMTSFRDSITFDAGDNETVDLTYASEYNTGFGITTYRDVKSEFNFSRFLYPCYDGQYSYNNLNNKSVNIIFSGTKEIVEFINPAYSHSELQAPNNVTVDEKNKIIYDFDNDITIVNATLSHENLDLQFVFRFIDEEEYKSIVIERNDWIKVDDDNYKRELEIGDLFSCNVHEIDVEIDDTWIVNSEVLTTSGDRIIIAKWSNYSQNQMGKAIKIFIQDDLEIDQLLLKIKRNRSDQGYEFQKYFDAIPEAISLKEYVHEVSNLTHNRFDYSTNEDFNLVKTSFEYRNDNVISSWNIFQSSSSISDYTLPVIKSEFLDGTTLMKSSLINPVDFLIQFYSVEADIVQVFQETGIDRQLQCLSFNSSYESIEF